MKHFISYCYLILSIFLCSCDSAEKPFNRLNEEPSIAPYSRYIKKQVFKTEANGELESVANYQYTKSGNILSSHVKYTNSNVLETSFEFDYKSKKFNHYNQLYKINITGGNFVLDNNNDFIKLSGVNDGTIFNNNFEYSRTNTFKDGKIILSVIEVGELKTEIKMHWQNFQLVKLEKQIFKNNKLKIYTQFNYSYNSKKQLTKLESYLIFPDKKIVSSETSFSQYNKYGDWTKAITCRKNQNSSGNIITTRDIEYW
ncbi:MULTISPECIES: hypothetical protein [unclassified Gilliamella]|uniref:hypothetical protein n=1 Tax=unclassified Gilliamella TaxID=2685620 RepID=UPI00132CA8E5|nr:MULTISPECIES: hypothetical protein [unclassified Gilliamella]MWN31610.1 hypothetical protein [Gilliamella sp. Pra-s60]MWP28717.1 hypothetical protein [Gilliamella sp. Pra-s54]